MNKYAFNESNMLMCIERPDEINNNNPTYSVVENLDQS